MSILSAIGILIALIGIAIDYLLPGTSPGINLPQILIVAAGLGFAFVASLLRRPDIQQRLFASWGKSLVIVALIAIITLLLLELALTAVGIPTYFPRELSGKEFQIVSWRICDERGCRQNKEGASVQCAAGQLSGRHCIANRQGYADTEDFVVAEDFDERTRILTMGDSFTQGFSADVGKSFVETLEANFPEVVVWNTGITTTGTKQALAAFESFAPNLKPQLAILGFFMNDFVDNALPQRTGLQLLDADGNLHFALYFDVDRWGNPVTLPSDFVLGYAVDGYNPPTSELERITGLTRLGSLVLRTLDRLGERFTDTSMQRQEHLTRQYLSQLRDAVAALDSNLLVVLIPYREDFAQPSEQHELAAKLMDELDIPYMRALDLLDPVEDYAQPRQMATGVTRATKRSAPI